MVRAVRPRVNPRTKSHPASHTPETRWPRRAPCAALLLLLQDVDRQGCRRRAQERYGAAQASRMRTRPSSSPPLFPALSRGPLMPCAARRSRDSGHAALRRPVPEYQAARRHRRRAGQVSAHGARAARAKASHRRVCSGNPARQWVPGWPTHRARQERRGTPTGSRRPTPVRLRRLAQQSVKHCFVRGSVIRYAQLPKADVDVELLQDATRKESQQQRSAK